MEKDHEKYDKKYIIKEDGQQEDIFDISSDLVRFKNLRTLELDFK